MTLSTVSSTVLVL